MICVGHLGDSRVCLIYSTNENISKFGDKTRRAYYSKATSGGSVAVKDGEANAEQGGGTSDVKENSKTSVNAEGSGAADGADGEKADENDPFCITRGDPAKDAGGKSAFAAKGSILTNSIPVERVSQLIEGNFVTKDHKPDTAEERARIEASGGSVEYLQNHQNKPFIRGGDFQQRKLLGESPMQLQYSRAFGGKDLKPFGLVAEPTINVTKREKQFLGFILASDGLWDVIGADAAARVATKVRPSCSCNWKLEENGEWILSLTEQFFPKDSHRSFPEFPIPFRPFSQAYLEGTNPSQALVHAAMDTSGDNITALCVMYDTMGGER